MSHSRKHVMSILLTNRCNLRCKYCFVGNSDHRMIEPRKIDLRFAKKGIDDFFAQYDSRSLRFFAAGEPTLELELMKQIRDYAESKAGSDLMIELQTNGVFSSEAAGWIAQNVDIVWISCDGMPDLHDIFRRTEGGKPSSDVVENNISLLIKKGGVKVGVRSTISSYNVGKQREMVNYFHGLGITAMMSDPIFEPVVSQEDTHSLVGSAKVDPMDFARSFLDARERAEALGVFYGSSLTWNFDEPTERACRACIPYPHLTPDGYVSACDMATNGSGVLGELVYGFYDPLKDIIIYDERKIQLIRTRVARNMIDCEGCEVLFNCAGGCLGESLNETGSLFHVKKEYCDAIRFLAQRMPRNAGLYPYLHP